MKLEEVLNEDISTNINMENLKNDILYTLGYFHKRKSVSNEEFRKAANYILYITNRLKGILRPFATQLDKLSRNITSHLQKIDSFNVYDRIDKRTLTDALNFLYVKILTYLDMESDDLSVIAADNNEAKSKIQRLALIIHDKTDSEKVSDFSKKILRQTAAI